MNNSEGLGEPGQEFYRKVMAEYDLVDTHDLERLRLACTCLDEISEAAAVVKLEGRFIKDRFEQTKEHPATKFIRDNQILFLRAIRELGLDLVQPEDPRPRRQY